MKEKTTAIVLAAGQGKRMHSKIQKQFLEIQGHPVLYYSLKCFQESPLIHDIIHSDRRRHDLLLQKRNCGTLSAYKGFSSDCRRKRTI